MKNRLAVLGLVAGLVGGGAAGVALLAPSLSGAQVPSPTTPPASASTSPTDAPSSPTPAAGATSNEDATHEAGESAARETAEDNGTFHGGRRGFNEDATHEASESAAREAQENASADSNATTPSASSATTG